MPRSSHARFTKTAVAAPPAPFPSPMRIHPFPARFLIAVLGFFLSSPVVRSQEKDGEEKAPVLLRVLCKQPVADATDLKLTQGDEVSHDLTITSSLITEPLPLKRGEILLVRGTGEKPAPILKITIPDAGNRFVLALFAAINPTPDKPYEHRLVRTDGLRFGTSDVYLFNLTQKRIGGSLGKAAFDLAPGLSEVVTPKPDKAGGRVYQSRFYYEQDGKARIFNDTRWPLSRSARIYMFYIPDPVRQSVGYLTFREYEPFP